MSDRGSIDPLQRAITFREFVYRASATGMTNFNGTLVFFVASEDAYQNKWWELWRSDGTPEGTVPVRRAYTGGNQPSITLKTQFNEMLFFSANGVLDRAYDAGSKQVVITPGPSFFTAGAVLSASSPACIAGQPVPFTLGTAMTKADGKVKLTVATNLWKAGKYTLSAIYDGNNMGCVGSSRSVTLTVVVTPSITGGAGAP